jgi:PleD family two-component response regulator
MNEPETDHSTQHSLRTVALVTTHPQPHLLDTVLDAGGDSDVVFVESLDHAYSHIRRLSPHLVIVALDIDETQGFQLLSMLKLDSVTSRIPVVTYLRLPDDRWSGADLLEFERLAHSRSAAVSMN